MKSIFVTALVLIFVLAQGCANSTPTLHHTNNEAREPYVDVAVNLGSENFEDLWMLYDSLAAAGFRCSMRALSLNAAPIVVEAADFEHAKATATAIIIRDKLTVRVYKSADFEKSPANSLLEVWKKGQKTREETNKFYN